MISRRGLLAGSSAIAAYAALGAPPARAASGAIAGAIRWDAYMGSTSSAAKQAKATLSVKQWQFRAPAWAAIQDDWTVNFTPNQAAMDLEIKAANAFGLKFWGYDQYALTGTVADLMNGLALHRKSSVASLMNYCVIMQLGQMGGTGAYGPNNATVAALTKDAIYQRVGVTSAPLIFLLWDATNFPTLWGSSNANVAAAITDLRAQIQAAGSASPYIVLMANPSATNATAIGADALGDYAIFPSTKGINQTYAAFDTQVQAQWASRLAQGIDMVPTVMTGLDSRPLFDTPLPFNRPYPPGMGKLVYVTPGTAAQVAAEATAALVLVNANPSQCTSKVILYYSATEFSEGGNVVNLTIGDPTGAFMKTVLAPTA